MTERYKANLKINEHDLDNEILQQPQKYYDWSYAAGEAKNERDDAKDDLDIIRSTVDAEVREKHQDLKEGAVKSKVDNDTRVKKQRRLYMKARRKYNLLEKAEKGFEQRMQSLKLVVQRQINNMWSDPSKGITSYYQKEVHDEFINDVNDDLDRKMKNRIKRRRK